MLSHSEVLAGIKDILGYELQSQERLGDSQILQLAITPQMIRTTSTFLANTNYYLHTMFGRRVNEHFEIYYLILSQVRLTNVGFLIQITQQQEEFPTIADIFPNASHWQENVSHRIGIEFHIELQQVKDTTQIHDNLSFCLPYSLKVPKMVNPYRQIGIFHPIHSAQSYIHVHIDHGDTISKIELTDGWLHQNVCARLESANPIDEIPALIANLSPTCTVSLKLAYLHALEETLEISIPLKAKFIRTLLAEVERISSHLLWFSNLSLLLGLQAPASQILEQYTALQILFQRYFQVTSFSHLIDVGTATDVPPDMAKKLYTFFKSKKKKTHTTLHRFLSKPYVKNRLQGRGQLTAEEALKIGLTGPALRGSGISQDIRVSHPYLTYLMGNLAKLWSISSASQGDCLARAQVRSQEIKESWDLCQEILHGFTAYKRTLSPVSLPNSQEIPSNRTVLSMVETPQGALSIYIQTGVTPQNGLSLMRILTPDAQNFGALKNGILKNEEIENVPLILHSLDVHFPLVDL
jgi:NADH:ubiquinone oxidoreductase subunit D/Ni,Fe-hydrogenase III component G